MTTTAGETDTDTDVDAGLICRVREHRATRDAAELGILVDALDWADAHTVAPAQRFQTGSWLEPDDGLPADLDRSHVPSVEQALDAAGLPELAWDAAASFAAALGLSTMAGRALIRDALILAHRLPRTFEQVLAGRVPVWRARRIAQTVIGQPDDVAAYLDTRVAPVAATIGTVLLDRVIDQAMLHLHAEQRELEQLQALDARYATLVEASINHTGVADFIIRGDWADLAAFDDTVALIADRLAEHGCTESLDVRRSLAVGILADPARALALLEGAPDEPVDETATPPTVHRKIDLTVHLRSTYLGCFDLTADRLADRDPVTIDETSKAFLTQTVQGWCSRTDTAVRVTGIIHCGGCGNCETHTGTTRYQASSRTRLLLRLRDQTCVFPYCTRPARSCDCDHIVAFDPDHPEQTPTCSCNLASLCRHHHRLKTHCEGDGGLSARGAHRSGAMQSGARYLQLTRKTHWPARSARVGRALPCDMSPAGAGTSLAHRPLA